MGLRSSVSQRQRRLGQELRKLREQADVSRAEVCRQVGIQMPHLSNIEAGRTACPEARLRALATAYGCTDNTLIDALIEMTNAPGKGWWSEYRRFRGTRSADLAELESMATAHRVFDWLYVPGLLQTPEYMRALFLRATTVEHSEAIDEYVNFRLHRQHVITEPPVTTYHAIIHEAAFHMRFVSREIMIAQLEYLVQASSLPNVTIQIIPFSADVHPNTPGTPFTIYDACTPTLRTVYVEHPTASIFLGDRQRTDKFVSDFDRLSTLSLAPLAPEGELAQGSLGFVQHLLYVFREGRYVGP